MSSDSSDDDVFRRRRPAIKRSVGSNGLKKRTNLSRYGKGIELTQNTKTKGSGEVWGDSSSDDGYASGGGGGSASGGGGGSASGSGDSSSDEEFEDAENEDKSKSDQEDNDKKGKSGEKEISKDPFSTRPIGGTGDLDDADLEERKNEQHFGEDGDKLQGNISVAELSDDEKMILRLSNDVTWMSEEEEKPAERKLLSKHLKDSLAKMLRASGANLNQAGLQHSLVPKMRQFLLDSIINKKGAAHDDWEKILAEHREGQDKKWKEENSKQEEEMEKRMEALLAGTVSKREYILPDNKKDDEIDDKFKASTKEGKEASRNALRGFSTRALEMQLVNDSKVMEILEDQFNNAEVARNHTLEELIDKAEEFKPAFIQELKRLYTSNAKLNHERSTKEDWQRFKETGLREMHNNMKTWYQSNRSSSKFKYDSDNDEDPRPGPKFKSPVRVRNKIDFFNTPTEKRTPKQAESIKEESEDVEEASDEEEEKEKEKAGDEVEENKEKEKEIPKKDQIDAEELRSTDTIEDMIRLSQRIVTRATKKWKRELTSEEIVKNYLQMFRIVKKYPEDSKDVQPFSTRADGQFYRSSASPTTRFLALRALKTKIEKLDPRRAKKLSLN